jgi:general secretion pathway protein G
VKNKSFTLIELMMVLIIIGILVGLISAGTFQAMQTAKESEAKGDISTLETAISMYEADVGSYVSGDGSGNDFADWLEDEEGDGWNGPYMHFKDEDLSESSFKDPWGNAYNYKTGAGINNTDFVDIWSNGPDGEDDSGADDDITNW